MKTNTCDICHKKEVPINNTLKINHQTFCTSCANQQYPNSEDLKNQNADFQIDPTICSFCEKDFGDVELKKTANYPTCDSCEVEIKNRAFPRWVKAFFSVIILIVIGTWLWNWKYYAAYQNINQGNTSMYEGKFEEAVTLFDKAIDNVGEVEDIKLLRAYNKGMHYLSQDKSDSALVEFTYCKDKLPIDFHVYNLLIQAKMGSAFDQHRYDDFLTVAKENLNFNRESAWSHASLASAYSCLFVTKGSDSLKLKAIENLEQAKSIDSVDVNIKQYADMINYRLSSKKMITLKEYLKLSNNKLSQN